MGIKERKARLREKLYKDIIYIAMNIVKKEGYHALSLRKIAEAIDYSAPVIYAHFTNKEAVLIALSRLGYEQLNLEIYSNCQLITDPKLKLVELLKTYWNFAIIEKELYQLMDEVGKGMTNLASLPELTEFMTNLKQVISDVCGNKNISPDFLLRKSYITIATIHGLISTNLFWKCIDKDSNKLMLSDIIAGILNSLNVNSDQIKEQSIIKIP